MKDKIAVIGAGLMGHGIAQLLAAHGHPVHLYDVAPAALDKARGEIAGICDLLGQEPGDVLQRVTFGNDLASAVADADVVFEAAPEKPALKQAIFADLDTHCRADAILASNTSVIPIGRIAEPVRDKGRVLGTHFWNPPYLVPLVEVVETTNTRADVADRMTAILAAAGQEPVRVKKDIPGFIGNRLQHALKREAIALVAAGVADAATIDRVIKLGFGARLSVLGTLEQSDLVGTDLTLDIHRTVIADLDVTGGPHPYLEQLVAEGNLGMKSGRGFYSWTEESANAVRQRLKNFLAGQLAARRTSKNSTQTSD